jgi:hypothetical protein
MVPAASDVPCVQLTSEPPSVISSTFGSDGSASLCSRSLS